MLLSGVEVCCAPPAMGQAPNGYSNDALALALAAYLGGAAQVSRRAVVRANRGGGPHGASRQPGARHGDRLKDGGRDRCGAALGYFGLRDVWMIRLEAVGVETSHPLPQAWPPPLSKSDPGVGSRVDRFYMCIMTSLAAKAHRCWVTLTAEPCTCKFKNTSLAFIPRPPCRRAQERRTGFRPSTSLHSYGDPIQLT